MAYYQQYGHACHAWSYSNQYAPMYQPQPTTPETYKPAVVAQTLEVDKETVPGYRKQTFAQKRFGGLKRTLRAFLITACITLAINVGWMCYAKSRYGIVDGYGVIETGDCSSVKRRNTWFHLAINILSTLLLTGSNAFMAAYSGPTRQEIDKAHARRRWLHVGSVSFRNMLGISWKKSLIVLVLASSSIPFHLLYNSLIFTSLSTNDYYWAVVTEDFLTGASFNLTGPSQTNAACLSCGPYFTITASLPDNNSPVLIWPNEDMAQLNSLDQYFSDMQKSSPNWERLNQKECIQAYSNSFVSTRRNVILVSSAKNDSTSIVQYGSSDIDEGEFDNNWWICSEGGNDGGNMVCNPQTYIANATSWQVYGHPIEYCLSEQVHDTCSVKFSMNIMIVVVAFNALKVLAMLWILWRLDAQQLITCVGDAASSFINQPDQTTIWMCLADRREIDKYWRQPIARHYNGLRRRQWGQAISRKRWMLFVLLMVVAWFTVFIFGAWGFIHTHNRGIPLSPSSLWTMGFGTINQNAMVFYDGGRGAVSMSVVANLPQVVLALIYLMYMGIMTAMFNAVDWSRFATAPQTLMVSTPTGKQRGTWLLGAPITYGVGLLALQSLLHWFVSQSLFVVQMTVYDKRGQIDLRIPQLSNCGYSPIAIICSVVASGVLFLTAIVFMVRRLPAGAPPVVSTCSAAISAACHVPMHMTSEELVYGKLRWGVTSRSPNGVGHCSLAPEDAWESGFGGPPVIGRPYAGMWKDKKD